VKDAAAIITYLSRVQTGAMAMLEVAAMLEPDHRTALLTAYLDAVDRLVQSCHRASADSWTSMLLGSTATSMPIATTIKQAMNYLIRAALTKPPGTDILLSQALRGTTGATSALQKLAIEYRGLRVTKRSRRSQKTSLIKSSVSVRVVEVRNCRGVLVRFLRFGPNSPTYQQYMMASQNHVAALVEHFAALR
jgi:hypothetical protein